jgi:membrane peptidoglycan carboxypeptidase
MRLSIRCALLLCLVHLAAREGNPDAAMADRQGTVVAEVSTRRISFGSSMHTCLSMRCAVLLCLVLFAARASDLETAVARAMADRQGAALVAEVSSGRVLAGFHPDVARAYAASPGSALKPFTLAAWMDAHRGVSPAEWACPRQLRLAGRRLDCTHPVLAVPLDAATALAYSCNCYFAHLALQLQAAEFARALRRVAANVSTASTPEELQLQAIGEWGILVTPSELLAAYCRLAQSRNRPDRAAVLAGLEGAVAYGSAQLAAMPGLAVMGKTGTGPGHAWFAGFAPAAAPKVAVVVFLEQGRGGVDAAPIAREIFQAWRRGER